MVSVLNNQAIYFIAVKPFTFNGHDYSIGEMFPQEKSNGKIDLLVRTRRVVAVVNDSEDKPRHWHHHVWLRSDINKKLKILKNDNDESLVGQSLLNKPLQMALTPGEGNPIDEDEDRVVEEDLYDPAEHSVAEVLEYLTSDISEEEQARVLAAENLGKSRKGIVNA